MKSRVPNLHRKLIGRKENKTVDYLIVIAALLIVGLYALLIGWLLPQH